MMTSTKKILIAEDEKPMAHALELKLKHSGFETKVVFDGQEALEAINADKFDLILLDLMMPKKDGFTVLTEMRNQQNNTPVIVLSNLSQAEDEEKAKKLGAKDYFVKTDIPLTEIIDRIKKVLNL